MPGPGPGQGWGPYDWRHNPWGPPPPPPKPGVIPLAPLGVDRILGGAFATMRRYAKPLFGTAAAAYGLLALLMTGALLIAYGATRDDFRALYAPGATFSWEHGRPLLLAFGAVWLAGLLGSLAVNSFIQAACAATLHEAVIGRATTFRAVWRKAWSRTPSVAAVTLLLALILLLPVAAFTLLIVAFFVTVLTDSTAPFGVVFLLFLLVLPLSAWLYVLFAFAPAAAVLETAGPFTALRRSVRLVRGAWWRTFGISLLAGVIVVIVSLAFRLPLQFAAPEPPAVNPDSDTSEILFDQLRSQFGLYAVLGLLGTLLTQLLATVFLPLVTALLYIDRRIRKEGLAHALHSAA
ncbi:oxidoreductase [Streptomyces alboniger]|uniref:Oxidoreductase n=1 Tax=Streptomyces alboniger TaxID=132473 RepID=A0A5J6HBD0_STRAD|nr:oxidoreductase [Streptomyces alboniger]QEV17476.1 oxidoreductase [Streptomyces alboniger]